MTFLAFLQSYGTTFTDAEAVYEAFDSYLFHENQDAYLNDLKPDKDFLVAAQARDQCALALAAAGGNGAARRAALGAMVRALEAHGQAVKAKFQKRALKRAANHNGQVAMARAATPVPIDQQIGGDRVLHFTSAFAAIVASSKLRLNRTSDQGCIFCIPARYAGTIAHEPPATVKQMFDIRGDLSHYLEFNLENSRDFESYNSHIDGSLKGQLEVKVSHEILELNRRNPQWYEWKGKSQGGWVLVPGPYDWKTA